MADKISVDELKVFVGTGLRVYNLPEGINTQLWSVSSIDFELGTSPLGQWECLIDEMGVIFKPMVRPLSNLIQADIKEVTGFSKSGTAISAFIRNIKEGRIYLSHAQKLASKHYDIFNWLNRTGEDGTPFAVELTDK